LEEGLFGKVDWTDDISEAQRRARYCLHRSLKELLESARKFNDLQSRA